MVKRISIKSIAIIIIFLFLIIGPITAIIYMNNLNNQRVNEIKIDGIRVDTLVFSQISPDGKHRLSVYISEGTHSTVRNAGVVFVSAIESGKRWRGKDAWSLYYGYRHTDIIASWIDNDTIIICSTENNDKQFELKMNIYQDEF